MQNVNQRTYELIENELSNLSKHFQDWVNGTIEFDEFSWLENKMYEDWQLVNAKVPGMMGDKSIFMNVWKQRFSTRKENPIEITMEIRNVIQLSEGFYLTTHIEETKSKDEVKSRPMTTIFMRDLDTAEFFVFYVHE